jgi:protein ImuB
MFASLHGSGNLTALAFEFSPTVERTATDTEPQAIQDVPQVIKNCPQIHTVTFDASGLDHLFGMVQDLAAAIARRASETGVKANLALAANPDAAILAARGFTGISILPQGDEAKFLGRLPLALLSPSPELQETLERWGIRRFQELATLPPLGIAERLGPEGLRLRQLARGEAERKLVPLEEPLYFRDELELEYPVELLEPLAFVLSRLLNGLVTRLATRGLATDELRLSLRLENREVHGRVIRLPVPSLDSRAFLKLLQLDLTAHPPIAPVMHVALEGNPVKPRAAQSGLFVPQAPEPVKLELMLARIKAIVGDQSVGSPELLDTHRPGAFRMMDFGGVRPLGRTQARVCLALRVFRPPRAARVAIHAGQPGYVAAAGVRGKVLELAGPWRTSGDWWTSDPWSRDEWDIALSDGALYRIYCARLYAERCAWFVEGSYD